MRFMKFMQVRRQRLGGLGGAACLALAMLGANFGAQAHELQSTRATLVLRDSHQLSLTLYVNYVDTLYKTLAPGKPFEEFVMVHAAMPPAQFAQAAAKAHRQLESATQLSVPGSKPLTLTHWRWPVAAQAQSELQQRAMQLVAGPGKHQHESISEIQAEALSVNEAVSATLKLPEVLQPALLVSYRASQVWMAAKSGAKTVKF